MARERLGSLGYLVLAGALAGCGAPALTPSRQTGISPPASMAVDAGAPPGTADAGTSPATVDAGTPPATVDAGTVVRPAPTTLLTGADLSTAVVLAADGDGIYWVDTANRLWMLPTGSQTARQLAADPNPPDGDTEGACLIARGKYLFWSASVSAPAPIYFQTPLHRTEKAGGDVVLFPSFWCLNAQPAADEGHLYYVAGTDQAASVVALPLDADPGTAPTALAPIPRGMSVAAVAADNQYVYWNEWPLAEMVPVDEGPLFRGDTAALGAGDQAAFGQFVDASVWALWPVGGDLYIAYQPTFSSARIARVNEQGTVSDLPLPSSNALAVVGDWVVTSTGRRGYSTGKIYAASADAVAGDGSLAVEIGDDVAIAPVAGVPGLVFVDGSGHLRAVSVEDVGAAVAAGQR